MDAERLLGSLIQGALSGGRKRGGKAMRFLSGGSNSFLNASTLLTAAGIAWGLLESAGPKTTVPSGGFDSGGTRTPPPLPPLPGDQGAEERIPPEVLRAVRLAISAARVDGQLSAREKEVMLLHARAAGAEDLIARELDRTVPLSQIVAAPADPRAKEDLYTLAFAIIHADEGVSGAERIYLAQLALLLDLDETTVQRIEQAAIAGIATQSEL